MMWLLPHKKIQITAETRNQAKGSLRNLLEFYLELITETLFIFMCFHHNMNKNFARPWTYL